MKINSNSIFSTILFGILIATLMALEEFYEGEMNATTAIEEILAYLSILLLLFLFIVTPFQKLIQLLNKRKIYWTRSFFKRLLLEGLAVMTLSVGLGFIFGEFIHLYIDHVLPEAAVVARTILFLLITTSIIMALLELRKLNDEKEELVLLSEQLEKEKIETLYNSLKQQVNPHFLFNSLSVLSSLIHYDVKKAEIFIQKFADIYRYVLDINKSKLVSLKEEMDFLNSYLYLHKIRFGDNIEIESSLNESHNNYKIPPLSLQLIFENIMKHNIISSEFPMKISLNIKDNSLEIKNSLQAKSNISQLGTGNQNLIEKYKLLKTEKPQFILRDNTYSVFLPLVS